jgi:predicted Fe-Mo cluster-binding NifX family protein
MKIAVPTADGLLCPHFGHCQVFTFIEVDLDKKEIIDSTQATPPPHEPGVLPKWLEQMGCDMAIVGGMGRRALALFEQAGIQVISGAPVEKPEDIVRDFLSGQLETGFNLCDDPGFHKAGKEDCDSKREH